MDTMVIPRYIRMHKKSMLWLLFVSGLGLSLWRVTQKTPSQIHCALRTAISDTTCKQLKAYLTLHHTQSLKPTSFIKDLKDNFLWIKNINLELKPNRIIITIDAHTPFVILNNSLILTKEGIAFEKNVFNAAIPNPIPLISLDSSTKHNPYMYKEIALFVQQLPDELLDFYRITWKNSHAIYLIDKTHPNFTLITSAEKSLSYKKLHNCLRIKSMLHTQLLKKTTDQWDADIRFADHIIVKKRGNAYGTHVS